MNVAYWQRLCCTGTLVIFLLPACSFGNRPAPIPQELTEAGVQARFRIAADSNVNPVNTVGRLGDRRGPSEIPAPDTSCKPASPAFLLAEAIAFAQQHSPRLQSARAAIERASGQQQAAFAPFLPEVTLASQNGTTTYNPGAGSPWSHRFSAAGTYSGQVRLFSANAVTGMEALRFWP